MAIHDKPPWTLVVEVVDDGAIYDREWPHTFVTKVDPHRHFTLTSPEGRILFRDSHERGPTEDYYRIAMPHDNSWLEIEFWGQADKDDYSPWEHIILRAPYFDASTDIGKLPQWRDDSEFYDPEVRLHEIQVGVDHNGIIWEPYEEVRQRTHGL